MIPDLLASATLAGLLWFPFVLALGLTHRHLKIVDVSVDGVVVMAGIAAAGAWVATGSYALSVSAGALFGVAGALATAILIHVLRIDALLAGILVSLALHSTSVVLVGESMVVSGTRLAGGGGQLWLVLVVSTLMIGGLSAAAYRTNIGVVARALGSNPAIETPLRPELPMIAAMCFSGLLLGVGAGLYVHVEGVARAGSGFEFLLTGLTSFLVPDRIIEYIRYTHERWTLNHQQGRIGRAFRSALASVWLVALFGTIIFQCLIYLVITFSPRPDLWRLILALCLAATLASRRVRRRNGWPASVSAAGSDDAKPLLVVEQLSKTFRDVRPPRQVLRDVTFRCVRGLTVLTGPNGAGKTSLLRCISGDVEPDTGTISIHSDSAGPRDQWRRNVFYLQQEPHGNLAPDLSLFENLIWATADRRPLLGISTSQSVTKPLHQVGPEVREQVLRQLQTRARDLSGGEAQCAALVMAALSQRPVLLADEPTGNLDPENQKQVRRLLRMVAATSVVLAATHDLDLVADADRTYVVDAKRSGGAFAEIAGVAR